jgi:hypothetical protein
MSKSHDGRFEIFENRRDDDSYMYSYSSYSFHVVSCETGDEIASYSGSWDQDGSGSRQSGVESVTFEHDEIVARHYDGTIERERLPTSIDIVEGGKAIELTHADGTVERRERRAARAVTKFGQPFDLKQLVEK